MRRLGLALALFLALPARAGLSKFTITCPGCQYEARFEQGRTDGEAKLGLPDKHIFFCKTTKKFVSFRIADEKKKDETMAVRTTKQVAPGYLYYSHRTCSDALVPLEYYGSHPKEACPVCGKGPVSVKRRAVDGAPPVIVPAPKPSAR